MELINVIQDSGSIDAHTIVRMFLEEYPDIINKLDGHSHTAYNVDLFNKFKSVAHMPVWALLELLSFGQLIMLGKFIANLLQNKGLEKLAIQMYDIKDIRNACAHDNCILNNLTSKDKKHKPSRTVNNALSNVKISKRSRDSKLSNTRIYQITAVLVFHKSLVKNDYIQENLRLKLQQFKLRLMHNKNYKSNITLSSFFDYFVLV